MNMQKPPGPHDKHRPGFLNIDTPVVTIGVAPDHMMPAPPTSNDNRAGPFGHGFVGTYNQNLVTVQRSTKALEQEYQTRSSQLPQSIEAELAASRFEGPTDPLPPLQSIIREMGVLNTLTHRKAVEFHSKTATANAFYGGDPFNRHINEFMTKATTMEKWPGPNGIAMQALNESLRAAIDARLLSQTLQSLNQRSVNLQQALSVMQAAEQARLAAEQEAQRVAAEQARIKAEAEALAHAQEQARLAALAEAERLAAEQTRIAAEAAARYIAAEQARLEAEAEVERQAEQLRLERQQQAEEEALLKAMESLNAAQANRPFPVSGSVAASGPVFTIAAGTLATDAAISLAIKTALQKAVAGVIATSVASAGAVIGGFATLLFPSSLGNSDLYALSVPLSDLAPNDLDDLYAIAEANGDVELPVVIGSRNLDYTTEFFAATTNGTTVPSKVPVRLATFDPGLNAYRTYNPDAAATGMTWTPIVRPANASTTLPAQEPNIVVYNGTTVTAVEGRIDTSPALDLYSFGGFVYVFPIESGVPPLYVVFNSPYEGATVKGKFSGRYYNPAQAGGLIVDLNWRTAVITRKGVDTVKLHTARFEQSDANDIMIERLDRIFNGYLEITDTDLRYYTHEIRELERYRALGYNDDTSPSDDSSVWNNAHTATLEDYQLGSGLSLLYTKEAINAMNAQDQREYEKDIKGREQ
jgi:hypothetical protein